MSSNLHIFRQGCKPDFVISLLLFERDYEKAICRRQIILKTRGNEQRTWTSYNLEEARLLLDLLIFISMVKINED